MIERRIGVSEPFPCEVETSANMVGLSGGVSQFSGGCSVSWGTPPSSGMTSGASSSGSCAGGLALLMNRESQPHTMRLAFGLHLKLFHSRFLEFLLPMPLVGTFGSCCWDCIQSSTNFIKYCATVDSLLGATVVGSPQL